MIVFVTYVMYQEERRLEQALDPEEAQVEAAADDAAAAGTAASGDLPSPAPSADADTASPFAAPSRPAQRFEPARVIPARTSVLRNEEVVARISNGPALIESWRLADFKERLPDGDVPIELIDEALPVFTTDVGGLSGATFTGQRFEVVSETDREVVQRAVTEAGTLTRTIRLDREGYGFDLDLAFESRRIDPVDARFQISIPARTSERADFRELSLLAYREDEGTERNLVGAVGSAGFFSFGSTPSPIQRGEGKSKWAGFDAQFFAGVVVDPAATARLDVEFEALEVGSEARAVATLPARSIGTGGSIEDSLRGFLGPKTQAALLSQNASLEYSIDRGWSWLEPLTLFFELALDWLYTIIPNYGWAIIVLTILVRVVTAPLMVRQMRSAEKMREAQPKLKAIQERYADDRQKQSEEMMKFYREEGINPLGGCLPVLLQMPVLIGLFYALRTSIGLRHAPWILWIDDLSQPATLFTIPGLDFPVRILPLIMGGSMFVQQKMMPTTGMDPVQARMMLIMMPGMMLLISYTFPSGLVLYWTVSNLLGIAHQYWVRNHLQPK